MSSEISEAPLKEVDLSRTLHLLKRQHKLTVQRLADVAGVSKATMDNYLSGPSSPKATAIASLSKFFDVPADFILFGELKLDEVLLLEEAQLALVRFLRDLFRSDELKGLEIGSEVWMKKAEEIAFDRAWRFRNSYFRELENAKSAGTKIATGNL